MTLLRCRHRVGPKTAASEPISRWHCIFLYLGVTVTNGVVDVSLDFPTELFEYTFVSSLAVDVGDRPECIVTVWQLLLA